MAKKGSSKKDNSKKMNKYVLPGIIVALVVLLGVVFFAGFGNDGFVVGQDEVVAVVNDEEIRMSQVEETSERYQKQGVALEQSDVVEQMIVRTLLLQEADNKGVSVSESEAEQVLNQQLMQQGFNQQELEAELADVGMDYDSLLEEFRENLIIEELSEQEINMDDMTVSESEAREYFEENREMLVSFGMDENVTFEEMSDLIVQLLAQERRQQIFGQYVQQLMAEADIEIFNENLEPVQQQPSVDEGIPLDEESITIQPSDGQGF